MKKLINILSILGIVAAPCAIAYLYLQDIPALQAMAPAKEKKAIASEAFPLNQVRFVDFRADEGSLERLTEREQMDQLRDWLLFTVVSNKNLSTRELNQSLYDLPTVRYGYMKPVSNFEYGQTRSLYIGKGQVVALLPKGLSQQERMDELAHIADKHRKDTGEIPKSLEVFEYEINRDKQFALLTLRDKGLDAQKLFSKGEYGYQEAEIKSLDDLKHFMSQVDDVTFARVKGSSLILGGRKIFSRQYRGIRLEDVAAIWQSEKNIQEHLTQAQSDSPWQEDKQFLSESKKWLQPSLSLDEQVRAALDEQQKPKLVNGSGFSLDPSYDYRNFEKFLAEAEPVFQSLTTGNAPAITKQDIQRAKQGLAKNDPVPYLIMADKLAKSENPQVARLGLAATAEADRYRFQAARYDGDLQGTEVGMVLFYTDLLAKLWALDYLSTTPEKNIPDFNPLTKVKVSSIYKQEFNELPNTRLWFGSQDKGFQVADGGNSILFARNATRIYAASSNPLRPGAETTASANSEAFLGWWNDHYEEVARFEPEYERLNQIMKWSLLISWLNNANKGETLEFLRSVDVKRDNWFPDWVRANSEQLKFKQWNRVRFYNRGYNGSKTEAMPLLVSEPFKQFGEILRLSGGVSLANKDLFEGRAALPKTPEVGELGLRSNLNYNDVKSIDNELNLNTLEGTTYQLKNIEQDLSLVRARAKDGAKFRSPESDLTNLEFTRNIIHTDSGVEIKASVGGTELGSFSTVKTENGFSVGWRSRDIDRGQSLAMYLTQGPKDIETSLLGHPDVESLLKIPTQPPDYLVKMYGSKHWFKLAPEKKGSSNIPPGWHSRVGGFEDNSRNLNLAWVDEKTVKKQLAEGTVKPLRYDPPKEGATDNGWFVENLENRKYDVVARDIADNPKQFLAFKTVHFNTELKQIDKSLQAKNYTRAAQHIDSLISIYGPKPDLRFRKAVADIGQGRLNIKRITPDGRGIDLIQSKANFLDEVNALLRRGDGKVNFFARKTKNSFSYVQDDPGLNNIDWNQSIDPSTPLISAKARVYQLQPGEIGEVKLSLIGYGEISVTTQPSTTSNGGNLSRGLQGIGRDEDDKCEKGKEKECCEQGMEEYCDLQSQEEKPIYIVISPTNN